MHAGTGWENSCRVMALDCETPLTTYANVPLYESVNVNVALPSSVAVTPPGNQGDVLKGGPFVRYRAPV